VELVAGGVVELPEELVAGGVVETVRVASPIPLLVH
jgi:hypothetical protein